MTTSDHNIPHEYSVLNNSLNSLIEKYGSSSSFLIGIECALEDQTVLCGLTASWPKHDGLLSLDKAVESYNELVRDHGLFQYLPNDSFGDTIMHFVMCRITTGSYGEDPPEANTEIGSFYISKKLTSQLFACLLKSMKPSVISIIGKVDPSRSIEGGLTYEVHTLQ